MHQNRHGGYNGLWLSFQRPRLRQWELPGKSELITYIEIDL